MSEEKNISLEDSLGKIPKYVRESNVGVSDYFHMNNVLSYSNGLNKNLKEITEEDLDKRFGIKK